MVDGTCLGQVPALLEHVEGNFRHLLLLLNALNMEISADLSLFVAKCSAYGAEHANARVCAHTAHKKHVCPCITPGS